MPFIDVSVNVGLNKDKKESIKTQCGKAISLIPGKSESYLMVKVQDNCSMWFKGAGEPCAMCSVSVFGNASSQSCEALTKELCEILEREADIDPSRTYVKFQFIDTWGYNGFLF